MGDKERKIKIRGGHRSHIKKLMTDAENILKNYDSNLDAQMMACKQGLQKKMKTLDNLDQQILMELNDEEDIDGEIETADNIQNSLREKIIEIEMMLEGSNKAREQVVPASTIQDPQSNRQDVVRSKVKLPKLQLKRFHGDPKDYKPFKDIFEVSVNKDTNLSNIEKFTYLQSCLQGDALRLIAGLSLTDENYKEAFAILDQRYGNKQTIVNSHMNELVSLPAVTSMNATRRLRELHDKVETNLRSLQSIGVDSKMYGCLLVPILKTKLPSELNLIISRKFDSSSDVWTIEDIMRELKRELMARESCDESLRDKDRKGFYPQSIKQDFRTTEALFSGSKKHVGCAYCDGNHYSDQCRVVTDVSRRKEILKQNRRCFRCTRVGHMSKDCRVSRTCFKCKGWHHTSICEGEKVGDKKGSSKLNEEARETSSKSLATANNKENVFLQTARVTLSSQDKSKSISCKMILDTGSQRSYVTKKATNLIEAPIHHQEKLTIEGFGGNTTATSKHNVIEMSISRGSTILNLNAIVVEKICLPVRNQSKLTLKKEFPDLVMSNLADDIEEDQADIHLLIGMDHYWDIVEGETVRGRGGTVAVKTRLGYVISGQQECQDVRSKIYLTKVMRTSINSDDIDKVRHFWDLESIGIKNEPIKEVNGFKLNLEKREDRYYVNMPWKEEHPMLGDNYNLSKRRLSSTMNKLRKNPILLNEYSGIMAEQERLGIIEEIDFAKKSEIGKIYYMPHHAVIREDKETTKVRVVYDASSKEQGVSLNEVLEPGITTFTDLLAVLLRFRCYKVGVVADIEKAFLSVGIKEEDRDALRFLWPTDPTNQQSVIRHMRFTRVCFGIISSMAQLDETIRQHLKKYIKDNPQIIKKILQSLYVDDITSGAKDVKEAIELYHEVKQIFKDAGMNVRKWKSNSQVFLEAIKESSSTETKERNENPVTKVLGVHWDTSTDKLTFKIPSVEDPTNISTRRELLRFTASIFDPLGILSPLTLKLKVLFQRACKEKSSWDSGLSNELTQEIKKWLINASAFDDLLLDRYYLSPNSSSIRLVGFCDASGDAYAAVVYCVSFARDGKANSSLICSKTRVAPLALQTIPRLELLGALILSRLVLKISQELQNVLIVDKILCMTDSEVVLNWIQREEKQYKQFVQNRVIEIRKNTSIENWYHVPGKENIADLPSRGCNPSVLADELVKTRWLRGPEWLVCQDMSEYPIRKNVKENWSDLEVRSAYNSLALIAPARMLPEMLVDPKRFSSLEKLLRVTAWCLRLVANCKKREIKGNLQAEEIIAAKQYWIKGIQGISADNKNQENTLKSLGVFKDENGIQRCKGRIKHSDLSFDSKYPILLPRKMEFTRLMIKDAHERVFHNGIKETLSEIRSSYWIPKGRQAVKQVVRKCYLCRRLEGMAYPAPVTADLPDFRVLGGRTFQTAGVDFAGPLFVKDVYHQHKDTINKAYIALMTCSTSRMVNLELVPDLTTPTFIRAMRRFIASKGRPEMMVSDNGKTFKGKELKSFCARNEIKWRFNLPRAPWWGGMFERMVKATKRCLRKIIGSSLLSYEELTTVLAEIETILNNRPLTYLEEGDLETCVSPSHLHFGRRIMHTEHQDSIKHNITRNEARGRTKQLNSVIEGFWKRWRREYLLELRQHHKINTKAASIVPSFGDVVLVEDDSQKRNKWKLGRILELIKGSDGVIRGAKLQTTRADGGTTILSRPTQHLFPLEISNQDEDGGDKYLEDRSDRDDKDVSKCTKDVKDNIRDERGDKQQNRETKIADVDAGKKKADGKEIADFVAGKKKADGKEIADFVAGKKKADGKEIADVVPGKKMTNGSIHAGGESTQNGSTRDDLARCCSTRMFSKRNESTRNGSTRDDLARCCSTRMFSKRDGSTRDNTTDDSMQDGSKRRQSSANDDAMLHDELDELIERSRKINEHSNRPKRTAGIDGQLRRRMIGRLSSSNGGACQKQ